MFNKNVLDRLRLILKNRDYSSVTTAFLYAGFHFLGLIFAVPVILILWILKPVLWIKVGGLQYGRIGHLALNTDLFLRRRKLIAKIDEQILLATDSNYKPTKAKWVHNEDGTERKLEIPKRVRRWWIENLVVPFCLLFVTEINS